MQSITVICPDNGSESDHTRLDSILKYSLEGIEHRFITHAYELGELHNERLLFAISLGKFGINHEYYAMLGYIRGNTGCFSGSVGGIIVDSESELYTKSLARELVLAANMSGCAFLGQPLVEGTETLANFTILAQLMETDNLGAYYKRCRLLAEQLGSFTRFKPPDKKPNILMLHASGHKSSNTIAIWESVKAKLKDRFETKEIGLRNGTLSDCAGCPYTTCLHFGERGSCFYGGIMADEVYPAVLAANAVVMLCPNYNDALSANLTACINRLTALFRTVKFYDKALFGIVVSGYSGSDIVAQQLIAALNMNKTFFLPANFCIAETANNAGTALKLPDIDKRISAFADNIIKTLT